MATIKDNSAKFLKKVESHVSRGVVKATLLVEKTAKEMCPVDTGTLRRSITHEFLNKTTAIVGSNVIYAPHVELGTSKMAARPFLRRALHANLKQIRKFLREK